MAQSARKKPAAKASVKKQKASKKAAPAKSAKKGAKKTRRDELLFQLSKIIKELNEEGLAFLIKQALVLRHNMQVDEIREGLSKAKGSGTPKGAVGKAAKAKPARKGADKLSIEIVEGENSRNFVFVINNYRNFFSLEEMRKIVAMCHSATDVKDGSMRLYAWFKRERMDVISNTDIGGPGDVALETIYNAVISKYTVRS